VTYYFQNVLPRCENYRYYIRNERRRREEAKDKYFHKKGEKRGKEPLPYLKSIEERKPFLFQARRSQSNINPDHRS